MSVIPFPAIPTFEDRAAAWPKRLLLAVLITAALLPRLSFLNHPFDSDSGLYILMGRAVVEGQSLYHDFYETKLPGVALFCAALYKVFGNHWLPYVLLQTAIALASAHLLAKSAARQLGQSAHFPTFLFATVFLNFTPVAYRGFQLETVQTFFASLSAYYATQSNAPAHSGVNTQYSALFLTGLFAGIAAMIKPTAGAVAAALIFSLLFHAPRQIKPVLMTLGALLIAPLLTLAWTIHQNLLPEMPDLLKQISLYSSGTQIVFEDFFKPLCVLAVGGFPFITAWIFRRHALGHLTLTPAKPFQTFLIAWLCLEIVGVVIQKRMYSYHVLPIAAPLAILFGQSFRHRRPVAYAAAFVPLLAISVYTAREDLIQLAKLGRQNLPASNYLLAHSAPNDTVFGDGIERLLMETHLHSGTRYAHLFYLANHDDAPAHFGQTYLADIAKNHPKWAVFDANREEFRQRQLRGLTLYNRNPGRAAAYTAFCNQLELVLQKDYRPVATQGELIIYQRREN